MACCPMPASTSAVRTRSWILSQPQGAAEGLLTNIGRSVSWDSPRFKIPRTYQYSFGIQQQLPFHILAEAPYTGNYQIYINMG